jgi:hypothetical protein
MISMLVSFVVGAAVALALGWTFVYDPLREKYEADADMLDHIPPLTRLAAWRPGDIAGRRRSLRSWWKDYLYDRVFREDCRRELEALKRQKETP